MREPKPWYRKFNDTWYVQLGKKQEPLARGKANKSEALAAFHRLMAGQKAVKAKGMSAALLCDLYLDWSLAEHKPATHSWYKGNLQSFVDCHGRLPAPAVTPADISKWLERRRKLAASAGRNFGVSSRRGAITAIKSVWSWAEKNGHLEKNPLKNVERPAQRRRRPLTPEEISAIFSATKDRAFLDLLKALRLTGARPAEVCAVTAAQVREDSWVLAEHKTDGTGEARTIYLNEEMKEITLRRARLFPDGPIFRTTRGGRPWNRNAIRCRFRSLRKRLNLEAGVVAYGLRHAFCTDALERGVPVATVAQLMGHRDLKMVQQVYSHLHEKTQHLRDAARQATST